jgi:Eco29kI restriction endonuclease
MDKKIKDLQKKLKELLDTIPEDFHDGLSLSESRRKTIRKEIIESIKKLNEIAIKLDPILQPQKIFDPSDPLLIGELIAKTLLTQEVHPLASLKRFYGSGVYAIYYTGDFKAYSPIKNTETPIYVGKVDPSSADARTPEEQGDKLWARLTKDHAKNIKLAENLNIDDFNCRFLVVKSAWQSTAETYLINWFKPIWNSEINICYGFGKHGDDPKTRVNIRSPWDELHPGRSWAKDSPPYPKGADGIIRQILKHYKDNPPKKELYFSSL